MEEFKGRTALIVEDQDLFREAIAFDLESLGFSVATAKDGQEGFRAATASRYDLILSDIKMPNWDGRRFLEEFRKTCADVPFAFMTGFADLTLPEALSLGADAFLGKPLDTEKLLDAIYALLEPEASRWSAKPPETPALTIIRELPSITAAPQPGQCTFGRSGVSLAAREHEARIKVGEIVELDLKFDAGPVQRIQAAAAVVWKRPGPTTELGLAFQFIQEPGRSEYLAWARAQMPRASIPLYTSQVKER